MKSIIKIFAIGTLILLIIIGSNFEFRENQPPFNSMLNLSDPNSNAKNEMATLLFTIICIFTMIRIFGVFVWSTSRDILSRVASATISTIIELGILFIGVKFTSDNFSLLHGSIYIILSFIILGWKIFEIATLDEKESLFNIRTSFNDYIRKLDKYDNHINNLTQLYKKAIL